ncbi:hypothetical protein M3Y99_00924900 [Aphelenchoides fujianensis]|nr:hypothetical protein M3Y99_00924900 [Aphelenchoides fujianensis]
MSTCESAQGDSRDYCLCGRIHVHKAALIIGVVGLLLNAILLAANAIMAVYFVVPSLISIVCYALLLVAHRTRKTVFYPIVMFVNILATLGTFLLGAMYFIIPLLLIYSDHYRVPAADGVSVEIWFGMATLHAIFGVLQIWFLYIIFKSYKYVKEVLNASSFYQSASEIRRPPKYARF